MRWTCWSLLGLLLLGGEACGPCCAEDESATAATLAQEVVRAVQARDDAALKAIAETSGVDPWEVVDELDAADGRLAAEELAKHVADDLGGEGLRAYVKTLPRARAAERRAAFLIALGQPPEEQPAALKALLPRAGLSDGDLGAFDVRVALAHALAAEGDQPESDWLRVVDLARGLGWKRAHLLGLKGHAAWLRGADRMNDSFEVLEHAAAWADRFPRWRVSADLAYDLGALHAWARRDHLAVRELEVAAARYSKLPDAAADEALTLSAIGTRYWGLGDLLTAASYTERALRLAGEAGEVLTSLDVRLDAAGTLELSGQADAALDELAAISEALKQVTAPAWALEVRNALVAGVRGRAQFLMHYHADARKSLRSALEFWRRFGEPEAALRMVTDLAWIESEESTPDDILPELEALALPEASKGRLPKQQVLLLEALGRAKRAKGNLPGAHADWRAALDLAREPSSLPPGDSLAVDLVGALAAVAGEMERHEESRALCEEYLRLSVGGVDGMDRGSRRTFRGMVAGEALAAGIVAARKLSRLEDAWTFGDAARGVRLLAALGGRSRIDAARLPADLRRELDTVQAAEEAARRQLAREREGGDVSALKRAAATRDEAAAARQRVAKRVAEERARLERDELHELGSMSEILSTRRIQDRLRAREAVVSYHVAADLSSILAMVLTKSAVRAVDLPEPEGLFRTLQTLRADASTDRKRMTPEGVAKATERMHAALGTLRAQLLDPLALPPDLRVLSVAPDGALAHVPYAALLPTLDVAVIPSASLYEALRRQGVRTGTRRLAVGLNTYGGVGLETDRQLAARFSPAPRDGQRGGRMRLTDLRNAAQEAAAVAGPAGKALTESDATGRLLRTELERPGAVRLSTLHFSCHGVVHPEFPELSGLALADGLFTAGEVMGLRLNTDLVVLSACDTGSDTFIPGEGMSGLVRAFLLAGSPRVLASLWKVPDDATAYLMDRFYEILFQSSGASAAEALRRAQELTRTAYDGKWASPENWAAWTLWGAP